MPRAKVCLIARLIGMVGQFIRANLVASPEIMTIPSRSLTVLNLWRRTLQQDRARPENAHIMSYVTECGPYLRRNVALPAEPRNRA